MIQELKKDLTSSGCLVMAYHNLRKSYAQLVAFILIACCMLPQVSVAVSPIYVGSSAALFLVSENAKAARSSQNETDTQETVTSEDTESEEEIGGDTVDSEDVRLQPGDTIYLYIEAVDVEEPITQFEDTKIYTLSYRGELVLPLVGDVPLAGLNESEAVVRLQAEPLLQGYNIELKILPLEPVGTDALELFGQSFFESLPAEYISTGNIPVPDSYVVGSGDTVIIQLYGKDNITHELVVSRDGVINFPDIGPVPVSGLTYGELVSDLQARVSEQLIGVKIYVTLGELRSIDIVLAGEVASPGSYTVSGMSTVTNALFASGGVNTMGSLRNIQVNRNGIRIANVDLYSLLLKGSDKNNIRLQSGDVIFVPTLDRTVGVSGEVLRPAIYELKSEKTVGEVLDLAGGATSTAYLQQIKIERIGKGGNRLIMDLDGTSKSGVRFGVQNGDVIDVPRVLDQVESWVGLVGHVKRPGKYQWKQGIRLTDLMPTHNALKPKPDLDYVIIRRESKTDNRITVFSVDLRTAFADSNSPANVQLQPNDQVYVFGIESNSERLHKVSMLVDELVLQADEATPAMLVNISGSVRAPGAYPLEPGMTVSELVTAGGGLLEDAYPRFAELTRFKVSSFEKQYAEHVQIDLAGVLKGDTNADVLLQSHDHLNIKRIPEWIDQVTVEIEGEVRFPGTYPIARGESLSSVLERAGGLSQHASPDAAIFLRDSLRQKEGIHLQKLAKRLETDLEATLLEKIADTQRPAEGLTIANEMLEQLRSIEPVGRLVINLPGLLEDMSEERPSKFDIAMENGDRILIPSFSQEVSVVGEVFQSTSHLYHPDMDIEDYISASGGYTRKADQRNTYVIHPNGAASGSRGSTASSYSGQSGHPGSRKRTAWFGGGVAVRPGDTIVIPLNAEKVPTLDLWTDISQIIFNVGITAAAIENLLD